MKKLLYILTLLSTTTCVCFAQLRFNHLDLAVTGGSTGIGFDLASPISDRFQIRMGATFLPKFEQNMQFDIEIGEYDPSLTAEQNASLSTARFNKLSKTLSNVAGETINKEVNIIGEPIFNNFKFLIDFYPFKNNRHWHMTAGFYWGNSIVAKAYNTTHDMTEMMAVTMYNTIRKSALAEEPLIEYNGLPVYLPYGFTSDIIEYGDMSIVIGEYSHDIYAHQDILWDYTAYDPITGAELHKTGDIQYAKGDLMHSKGDAYCMVPNEDNMVKVNAKTNSFRPYIGFGYDTPLTKDKRTGISVEAGILFWGGKPEITTHDGTDVLNDLQNLRGKLADNVKTLSRMNIYPVFNFRLTRRLF